MIQIIFAKNLRANDSRPDALDQLRATPGWSQCTSALMDLLCVKNGGIIFDTGTA